MHGSDAHTASRKLTKCYIREVLQQSFYTDLMLLFSVNESQNNHSKLPVMALYLALLSFLLALLSPSFIYIIMENMRPLKNVKKLNK